MIIKRDSVVSHVVATQWGVGKVIEVNEIKATIRFNDGIVRKIISSHFADLQPANPASYIPLAPPPAAKEKAAAAPRKPRKAKAKAVAV